MFEQKFKFEDRDSVEIQNENDILINGNKTTIKKIIKAWLSMVGDSFKELANGGNIKDMKSEDRYSILLLDKIITHYKYEYGEKYNQKLYKILKEMQLKNK